MEMIFFFTKQYHWLYASNIKFSGIVAVLPSWARSLLSLSIRVCAALASGNTVVVCPSPDTSLSALLLAEVAVEAGLPAGVLNVLTDNAERNVMNSLVMHEETDKITFVGTTQVQLLVVCHFRGFDNYIIGNYLHQKDDLCSCEKKPYVTHISSFTHTYVHAYMHT